MKIGKVKAIILSSLIMSAFLVCNLAGCGISGSKKAKLIKTEENNFIYGNEESKNIENIEDS